MHVLSSPRLLRSRSLDRRRDRLWSRERSRECSREWSRACSQEWLRVCFEVCACGGCEMSSGRRDAFVFGKAAYPSQKPTCFCCVFWSFASAKQHASHITWGSDGQTISMARTLSCQKQTPLHKKPDSSHYTVTTNIPNIAAFIIHIYTHTKMNTQITYITWEFTINVQYQDTLLDKTLSSVISSIPMANSSALP